MSTAMNTAASTDISDGSIPLVVAGLRHGFSQGLTRPAGWRRAQLKQLRHLLISRGDDFERALFEDLAKSGTESQITEIGFLVSEIDHALAHMASWMRPKRVNVPLALLPAAARTISEPLGVVLIIAPWNYPLMLTLSPLIGALAAGNAAVLKPSELAPATSRLIGQLIPDTLDRGAVAVVEGGVSETTALLNERFDHIFYTGGGRVGRVVARAAAEHLTPTTLELGGKSPVFIDGSVSLPDAARRIVWAKFLNAGQTCVAPDYVLATRETLNRLTPHLVNAIHELYGSAIARNPDYGRIINAQHFERLVSYLDDGMVIAGGEFDETHRFIAPTVLKNVDRDSPVMLNEIFGPILPLVTVDDLDDALTFVASRDKPLAAYVFSETQAVRRRWEAETSSGALTFGAPILHLSVPELPFGGVGESGVGAYHGQHSFDCFSHQKAVLTKPLTPDTIGPTIMPPYTAAKDSLVRKWLRKLL